MKKIIGYIIIGHYERGLELTPSIVPEGCRKGILMHGRYATLFETRSQAKQAIRRTLKYADQHGLDNKAWRDHYIQSVKG